MRPSLPDSVPDASELEMPLLATTSETTASPNGVRPSKAAVLLALAGKSAKSAEYPQDSH
jgi:hypothetical protein